jgi:hypothetical protein
VRPQDRKNWQITPKMVLGSQIPRDLLYTPLSNPEFDYTEDLGNSGQEPYTRGLHANMYRGRRFEPLGERSLFLRSYLPPPATGNLWPHRRHVHGQRRKRISQRHRKRDPGHPRILR